MTRNTMTFSAFLLLGLTLIGCGEKKWEPNAEQAKLMKKHYWVYDRAESEKMRNDLVKETTGVTADIELKGDVGAMADALSASKFFFTQDKESGKPAWQLVSGSGLLSSTTSGWLEWQSDKNFVLKGFEKKDGKPVDVTYEIREISEDRVVLQRADKSLPEVYTKG